MISCILKYIKACATVQNIYVENKRISFTSDGKLKIAFN